MSKNVQQLLPPEEIGTMFVFDWFGLNGPFLNKDYTEKLL